MFTFANKQTFCHIHQQCKFNTSSFTGHDYKLTHTRALMDTHKYTNLSAVHPDINAPVIMSIMANVCACGSIHSLSQTNSNCNRNKNITMYQQYVNRKFKKPLNIFLKYQQYKIDTSVNHFFPLSKSQRVITLEVYSLQSFSYYLLKSDTSYD